MRVLYLHQYFALPESTAGTRSYEFARRLVERGHRVTMLTSSAMLPERYRTGRVERFAVEGIDVIALPVDYGNELGFAQRLAAFARFALSATTTASRQRFDVVFATSTPLTIAVPGLVARTVRRRPMVFEVRDLWPEAPIAMGILRNPALRAAARGLEWAAYHGADRVVALTDGMGDGVAARGIPRDRIHVIPNASDRALFDVPESAGEAIRARIPGLAPGAPLIVYCGTFGKVNGCAWLADLAAALGREAPEAHVLLVGGGAERDLVEARARELGVLDRTFHLWGSVPKRDLPAIFSAATISASTRIDVPALWENSANKLFDAFAAGRPVAINHGGWQEPLLVGSGAGLRWSLDPREAARQTAAFLAEPGRVERARAASRELAATRFDRDLLFDRFERVLLDAAGRR